jgi:GGDEF domain-containing protein
LNNINLLLGRLEADNLLCELGKICIEFCRQYEDALSGRIKAGEFAIMLPGESDATKVAQQLTEILGLELLDHWPGIADIYHLGVVSFERMANMVDILSKVDHALALAEGQEPAGQAML